MSSMTRLTQLKIAAALAPLTLLPCGAHADSYDFVTRQLTITSIQVGGTTYNNVVITIDGLVRVGGGVALGANDSYNAANNQLTIPSIQVGGITYTNVVITPGRVISIGGIGNSGGHTACNGSATPAGMSYAQSGSTISISTNGQCISPPTNGTCAPTATQTTGLNVLIRQNITGFSLNGVTFNIPGLSTNLFNSVAQGLAGTSCIKNAPAELSNTTLNSNVCYDVSQQIGPLLQSAANLVTITSPITLSMQTNSAMSTIADCMTSGADTITDATTGKVLIKQSNGGYLLVN